MTVREWWLPAAAALFLLVLWHNACPACQARCEEWFGFGGPKPNG